MAASPRSPRYVIKDSFLQAMLRWKWAALALVALIVIGYGANRIFGSHHGGSGGLPSKVGIAMFVGLFIFLAVLSAFTDNDPDLVVEQPGMRVGEAKIPWPSIRQIVVVTPDGRGHDVKIGVRLRFGAPLPGGMEYVIYDPRDPDALHWWVMVPSRRFDAARFDAAVRAFAPPDVRVAGEDPARAHGPERSSTSGPRQDAPATVLAVRMRDHGGGQAGNIHSYKPYPVVGFTLPDGRQVIAETDKPGQGAVGAQVMVSYDTDDPADVYVHGGKPRTVRRFTPMPGAAS